MSEQDLQALVKEHRVYRYFREELEFPEEISYELAIDIITCQ